MFSRLGSAALVLATIISALLLDATRVSAVVAPDEQTAMLAAHNKLRRGTAAAETLRLGRAVTIADLTWNAAAASTAQAWADHLVASKTFEHNAGRGAFGENMATFENSTPFPDPNPAGVDVAFAQWKAEATDYNWDANTCASECGHYTQLVWAASTSVGCGVATGPGVLIPGGFRTVWVCNYLPSGNAVGERPYEAGAPVAPAPPAPPVPSATAAPGAGASQGAGGFSGVAPARGSIGLLVTNRDSSATGLVAALTSGGCPAASIAVLERGTWKVHVVGAPAVVNSAFPASLAASTPFFVRCAT